MKEHYHGDWETQKHVYESTQRINKCYMYNIKYSSQLVQNLKVQKPNMLFLIRDIRQEKQTEQWNLWSQDSES